MEVPRAALYGVTSLRWWNLNANQLEFDLRDASSEGDTPKPGVSGSMTDEAIAKEILLSRRRRRHARGHLLQ